MLSAYREAEIVAARLGAMRSGGTYELDSGALDPSQIASVEDLVDGSVTSIAKLCDATIMVVRANGVYVSVINDTILTLRNAGKVPLPPGPFRVLRGDPSVPLEWVGTDWLPALAPGESVTLRLGPAAGLSGRRERKAFTETEPLKAAEESFEIAVANQTPFDRTIEVLEHLYRGDRWEIAASSAPYEAGPVPDSIVFRLPVKAGASRTVTYTVRYAW